MDSTANPELAYIWLSGDAYRAPAGTELPDGSLTELEIQGWDAFGGIEAGFQQTAEQNVSKKQVWNRRNSSYKIARDPLQEGMKFRAVDNTKATTLTRIQGGKVVKIGGRDALEKGSGEEFAFFARLDDGDEQAFLYCERATLSAPASRAAMDGQNIDGWEFDLAFLSPLYEIPAKLPDGMGDESDKKVDQPGPDGV